jgi:lipopolysaccharide/colanic/teichoic acid biosynthesis glycosyltransferase
MEARSFFAPFFRRGLAFSPLFARSLTTRGYDFHGQAEFNAMVDVERRRTERSGQPLILMLLDVTRVEKGRAGRKTLEKIAYALCASSRKVDVKGWYRSCATFGVVFTGLPSAGRDMKERLGGKMMQALSRALRPDELQRIKLSFHGYPEEGEDEGWGQKVFDLYLYPDPRERGRTRRFSLVLKRIVDLLGSAMALMVLLPLFLALAVAIRSTSTGPVLFRQQRMGLGGRPFTLLKFRSMYTDCDPGEHIAYIKRYINGEIGGGNGRMRESGDVFKMKDDRRVTPLGRLLRRASLDELPQFVNVLRGDMSLVGPRPPIPYEYEHYDAWHRRRVLEVKPGLTGLWYVRERSFWLDLKILFLTPGAVLHCRGAY